VGSSARQRNGKSKAPSSKHAYVDPLLQYKGHGGKKTMPKHLKKQLKAARRVRAQELDYAAQKRLLHDVHSLSGALRGDGRHGRCYSEPRLTKRGGHQTGSAKRGGRPPMPDDPATRLITTRHLTAISEDNKGHQMLRMMGWAGGGLGTAGEGLATPLTVDMRKGRKGLGHAACNAAD
jgi:hypothetical protein